MTFSTTAERYLAPLSKVFALHSQHLLRRGEPSRVWWPTRSRCTFSSVLRLLVNCYLYLGHADLRCQITGFQNIFYFGQQYSYTVSVPQPMVSGNAQSSHRTAKSVSFSSNNTVLDTGKRDNSRGWVF